MDRPNRERFGQLRGPNIRKPKLMFARLPFGLGDLGLCYQRGPTFIFRVQLCSFRYWRRYNFLFPPCVDQGKLEDFTAIAVESVTVVRRHIHIKRRARMGK